MTGPAGDGHHGLHELHHDPHHKAEADLVDKGLSEDAVGLFGSTILGISSVAPAYTLTATIGLLVAAVGTKMPVIFIAGFLPMFFAAYAYRELNRVAPDCGTSFTWTTKSFGPYIGWIGGWAAILATVIVLSNLAGVAVQFFYQLLGDTFSNDSISTLWENRLINVITCLAFLALATWISYRGITTTEHLQSSGRVPARHAPGVRRRRDRQVRQLRHRRPLRHQLVQSLRSDLVSLHRRLSGSIFAFWGWDTSLTVNEETEDAETTPGRAALLCVLSILLTYLLVSVATEMYAGVGTEGLGLGNADIQDNVFGALAEPVLGNVLHLLLFLAVLASSAASLITTFLPTSRTMLAMGIYGPSRATSRGSTRSSRPRRTGRSSQASAPGPSTPCSPS